MRMDEEEEDDEPIRPGVRHTLSPHHHDVTIFPPFNHEDLPIPTPPPPPPPHAPLSLPTPPSSPRDSRPFPRWVHFALQVLTSKLASLPSQFPPRGLFSSFRPVVSTVSFLLVGLWFWLRWRRWRRKGRLDGDESVQRLKLLVKEKDEKIIQLLEQIALMNKVLLAGYKIPISKPSDCPTNR